MALSCDEARRLLDEAVKNCQTRRSLAQVMVSLREAIAPDNDCWVHTTLCSLYPENWPFEAVDAFKMVETKF